MYYIMVEREYYSAQGCVSCVAGKCAVEERGENTQARGGERETRK